MYSFIENILEYFRMCHSWRVSCMYAILNSIDHCSERSCYTCSIVTFIVFSSLACRNTSFRSKPWPCFGPIYFSQPSIHNFSSIFPDSWRIFNFGYVIWSLPFLWKFKLRIYDYIVLIMCIFKANFGASWVWVNMLVDDLHAKWVILIIVFAGCIKF